MANKRNWFFMGTSAVILTLILAFSACASAGDVEVDIASFTNRSLMSAVTRITDDGLRKSHSVISPDGTRLLYNEVRPNNQYDIMMLRNVNSSAKTPLVTTGNALSPSWYEDNVRFLYSFREAGKSRIVRSSSAGGGRTNITGNPVGYWDQYTSMKNGVILMATADQGGNWQIYSMRENGSEITSLTTGFDPAWHPHEPKFLFVRRPPIGSTGNTSSRLWEMDLRTMQETMLHETPPYNIRRPQYTANGRHIVFQRGSEQIVSGADVTTIQSIGKRITRIVSTTSTESRWQLFSITSEGANESVLTEGNVDCMWPSLDRQNNLYFISNASGLNSNKTEIYRARISFE